MWYENEREKTYIRPCHWFCINDDDYVDEDDDDVKANVRSFVFRQKSYDRVGKIGKNTDISIHTGRLLYTYVFLFIENNKVLQRYNACVFIT